MHRLLLLVLALIVLGIEILLGSRAFFPELFEKQEQRRGGHPGRQGKTFSSSFRRKTLPMSPKSRRHRGRGSHFYPLEMFDERGRYTLALAATTSKFSPK